MYSNYDWNNPTIAVREAYAYHFENNPEQVVAESGTCFKK